MLGAREGYHTELSAADNAAPVHARSYLPVHSVVTIASHLALTSCRNDGDGRRALTWTDLDPGLSRRALSDNNAHLHTILIVEFTCEQCRIAEESDVGLSRLRVCLRAKALKHGQHAERSDQDGLEHSFFVVTWDLRYSKSSVWIGIQLAAGKVRTI